jgi:predicted nucleic acid-binding protein
LVVAEAETPALQTLVGRWPARVASRVAAIEVARVVRRTAVFERLAARTSDVLSGVAFVELSAAVADAAAGLEPPSLRAPDAIHLASALSLGGDLGAFVAYDQRLAAAAEAAGLNVLVPA